MLDIFFKSLTYAVFVSDTLNVYEINPEETKILKIINRFLISPYCHLKLAVDSKRLVLSFNDHYTEFANSLIYAVSFEHLVNPTGSVQVKLDDLPTYYAKYMFESDNSLATYAGNGK